MKAARRALGFSLFVVLPLSCAVYKDDILPSEVEDEVAGAMSSAGNAGALSSGATSNGGSSSTTAGTTAGGASGSGGGGSAPTEGSAGENGADGGESFGGEGSGGVPSGGMTNGGAGSGGKAGAGAGGKGGAGGGAGGKAGAGGGGQGGGGNGGAGGKAGGPLCSDHPITARATWVATASHAGVGKDLATYLTDNKVTRWSTNRAQMGDEWVQIDFGATVTLTYINLQQAQENMNDYPRQFAIIVSNEPNNLTGAVKASGTGVAGVSTAITLPALASGRYLLIKQLGTSLSWWSAVELEVSCVDKN